MTDIDKYEGDPEWLFEDYLEGKLMREEFLAGMKAMGFDDNEILEFESDQVECARTMLDVVEKLGSEEAALRHWAANARRSQFKVVSSD
jgi:hypothetical protein